MSHNTLISNDIDTGTKAAFRSTSMGASSRCRYLVEGVVPICSAFQGGIRTPRDWELDHLCRAPGQAQCPYFDAREKAESSRRPAARGADHGDMRH
jgi:hypothetical protein